MRSLLASSCPLLVQSFHLASVYWDYNYSKKLRCDGWPSLDGSIAIDACTRADDYSIRFEKYVHESSAGLYPKVSRQIFLDAECSQPDVDSTLGPITYSIDPLNDCECSGQSCLGVRLFRPETLVLARRLDLCLGSADDDRGVGLNRYAGGPTLDTLSWHFLSDGTLKQGDYSCLNAGNMTNGSPVTMEQCEAGYRKSQKWQLKTVDRCAEEECPLGTFQVALTNTPADSLQKCLDVPGGDLTLRKPLWIWDCQEAGSAALRNQLFFTSRQNRQSPPSPIDSVTV